MEDALGQQVRLLMLTLQELRARGVTLAKYDHNGSKRFQVAGWGSCKLLIYWLLR